MDDRPELAVFLNCFQVGAEMILEALEVQLRHDADPVNRAEAFLALWRHARLDPRPIHYG